MERIAPRCLQIHYRLIAVRYCGIQPMYCDDVIMHLVRLICDADSCHVRCVYCVLV